MLLVENLMLAGVAALVGLTLVYLLPPVIARVWTQASGPSGFIIHPDGRVLIYMGIVTLLTAVAAGLAPALESLNVRLGESLKGREILAGRGGITVTRALLLGVQVSFSMVLLVGAAGLIRAERFHVNPGFETRRVVSAELPRQPSVGLTPSSLAALAAGLPVVRSTAYADSLPAVFEGATQLEIAGSPTLHVHSAQVSPGYFKTLGIRILDGREFEEADASGQGDRPVVVSQRFARRFFPGRSPIGQILTVTGPEGKPQKLAVVGVAADRAVGVGPFRDQSDGSFVYHLKEPSLSGYVLVRFDGDANQVRPALQSLLKQATGRVLTVSTLDASIDRQLASLRGLETLMTAIGALGLALTLIGVFGLLAFTAVQRRKEVAIRTALGARRADVFSAMVRPALRPTGIGIAVGAFLSFAALRVTESFSRLPLGLPSADPVTYLAGGLLLLCAVFAAMSAPAYRATLSDPARALRED
jgi:ABC-type antimicrobial peptide transport system permease subunit